MGPPPAPVGSATTSNNTTDNETKPTLPRRESGVRGVAGLICLFVSQRYSLFRSASLNNRLQRPRRPRVDKSVVGRPISIDLRRRRLHIGYVRGPSTDDYTEGRRGFASQPCQQSRQSALRRPRSSQACVLLEGDGGELGKVHVLPQMPSRRGNFDLANVRVTAILMVCQDSHLDEVCSECCIRVVPTRGYTCW